MRYAREHKEETRSRVLDAAAQALRACGPDRMGVAGVMADAGLTHGGFYAHFDSKDQLVAAAIAHMFERSGANFRDQLANRSPDQGLLAYVDLYLSRKHRDSRSSGCPIAALSSDLPRLDEAARTEFSDGVANLAMAIAELLAAMGLRDTEALARSVIAELVGALSLARIEPRARRSDAILEASRKQIKMRLGLEANA